MRGENFIYFSNVSGFFIGIMFSILKGFDFFDFLLATLLITALFYLVALASISFYIKFLDIKTNVIFNKSQADDILDIQIKELEKCEDYIMQSFNFIRRIEEEELDFIRKKKNV